MCEMLTITAVRSVLSIGLLSCGLNWWQRAQCTPHAVYAGSFGSVFAKLLWPLFVVVIIIKPRIWKKQVFAIRNTILC